MVGASGTGLGGFRCLGWAGSVGTEVPKPSADAGWAEPQWRDGFSHGGADQRLDREPAAAGCTRPAARSTDQRHRGCAVSGWSS